MNDDDDARITFIDRLSRSNIAFTPWEAKFIDGVNEQDGPLNDDIRAKIDHLRKRYASELGRPRA